MRKLQPNVVCRDIVYGNLNIGTLQQQQQQHPQRSIFNFKWRRWNHNYSRTTFIFCFIFVQFEPYLRIQRKGKSEDYISLQRENKNKLNRWKKVQFENVHSFQTPCSVVICQGSIEWTVKSGPRWGAYGKQVQIAESINIGVVIMWILNARVWFVTLNLLIWYLN